MYAYIHTYTYEYREELAEARNSMSSLNPNRTHVDEMCEKIGQEIEDIETGKKPKPGMCLCI